MVDDRRLARSALRLFLAKLKPVLSCCSTVALTNASAAVLSRRGSRNDPTTRYSVRLELDVESPCSPRLLAATLVNRLTDRFFPRRLRRLISNDARGAS